MRRPSGALILIIALLLTGRAVAEPFEDATKAYYIGDYEPAYRLINPLAEQGLPEAQLNLGLLYDNGQGVSQDHAESAKWYRKAAEQGDATRQFNLGLMYENGQGLRQDYAEAVEWYRKAAEQGYAAAQNNLGVMYFNGQGVRQDSGEAGEWYRKA